MNRLEKELAKFLDFLDIFEGDKKFYDLSCTEVKIGNINYIIGRADILKKMALFIGQGILMVVLLIGGRFW